MILNILFVWPLAQLPKFNETFQCIKFRHPYNRHIFALYYLALILKFLNMKYYLKIPSNNISCSKRMIIMNFNNILLN